MFGFINLNKSEGWTSHDCVAKVRGVLCTKRVGHGGTLDPLATGVLPIAVGSATRLLQFLPTAKAYRAIIRFGITTTTDDLAGEVLQVQSASTLELAQLTQALSTFQGTLQQIPPIYSAIQVNGQRLYDLARRGESIQPEPRTVEISKIEILNWQTDSPDHPEVTLYIGCGPGTYIRSIARDLGKMLGTGATLAKLVRTQSCGFELAQSVTLETLEQQTLHDEVVLTKPSVALQNLPKFSFDEPTAKRWCQGQAIAIASDPESALAHPPEAWVRAHDTSGHFLGMGLVQNGCLVPKVVFGP